MEYKDIILHSETSKCLLCSDGPCDSACPMEIPTSRIIRAIRFENAKGAASMDLGEMACKDCKEQSCMKACLRGKIDTPVNIPMIIDELRELPKMSNRTASLVTDICGVPCENPFFLSSSVVGSNYEMVAKAFDMGWAGVAFKTIGLFVPNEVSPRFDQLQREADAFVGFKNIEQISDHTLEENLAYFKELKKNYPTKVLIVSIMGQNEEEWTKLAQISEQAGADIIECNFSCPHMSKNGLGSDVGTNPELVAAYTRAVRKGTKLPILAKMTPNITNIEIPAKAALDAGADGIAAINTIKSIMNINLDNFASGPVVEGKTSVGGYSGKAVKPIALRCIHDIFAHPDLKNTVVSGMGGIENWEDAAEFIAMGCSSVQVTTSIMQFGYRIIDDLIDGLRTYMVEHGFKRIEDFRGKAMEHIVPTDQLDRDTISFPKFDRKKCVGCGRCYLSCFDGGHQALTFDDNHKPVMDSKKCVGCHLCLAVCPTGAISASKRVDKNRI